MWSGIYNRRSVGIDSGRKIAVYLFQGYLRYSKENQIRKVRVTTENLHSILNNPVVPKNVPDRLNRFLLNLQNKMDYPGKVLSIKVDYDFPLGFAKNGLDLEYFITELVGMGLLKIKWFNKDTKEEYHVQITNEGWNKIEDLKKRVADTRRCFVAMDFDESMNSIWKDGIERAIIDAGYEPYRVDKDEHSELIPLKILVEIKRSKFIVADFTHHKNGVYFEAGYGMGFNLPVIWMCKRDDFDETHFDIKQFNHIIYQDETDLCEKLKLRIEALIS